MQESRSAITHGDSSVIPFVSTQSILDAGEPSNESGVQQIPLTTCPVNSKGHVVISERDKHTVGIPG